MRKTMTVAASLGAALLAAGAAQAATFTYSTDFGSGVGAEWAITSPTNTGAPGVLGELGNGGGQAVLSRSSVGASATNAGTLTFDLLGFRTLDGTNGFDDVFSLWVNGVKLYEATFALGGGGGDAVYTNVTGATYTSGVGFKTLVVPFTVAAGANSFDFRYANLQSFGDEAWGLDNVSFAATVADPSTGPGVPEPTTWAMMILGFGATGAALRSRRRAAFA